MPPSSSGASPASARSSSPAPSTTAPPAASAPSSRSTEPPSPSSSSSPSSSATSAAPSPVPTSASSASSSSPTAAPSSSTRSARCPCRSRPSSCTSCRIASSLAWAPAATPRPPAPRGSFRETPYSPLNVFNILVPPLRDRPEEIPILAEHFWQKYSRQYNRALVPLSRDMLERFQVHPWPGNVRELENLVKRIVVLESEEFVTQELTGRGSGLAATNGVVGIRAEREQAATVLSE